MFYLYIFIKFSNIWFCVLICMQDLLGAQVPVTQSAGVFSGHIVTVIFNRTGVHLVAYRYCFSGR